VLAIPFVIKKRDTSFQPSQIRLNTMTEIPFKAVLIGAVAGIAVATFYLYDKISSQELKLLALQAKANDDTISIQTNQLKLHILALQTKDIQTLNGKSVRKEWIKQHPHHDTWTSSLLSVQQSNFLSAPPRPSKAQDLALYNAAEAGDWEEAKSLLEQGYSPNDSKELHPKFGTTPLMEACFHGHQTIVQLYIEHNALLNTQSGYGWTALHYAGQANKIGCAGLLMAAGCNNLLKNSKGKTPQVRAAAQGKDEMAALI
jgi:hypothetical protein